MRVGIESNRDTCAHYFKMQATWKTQSHEVNQAASLWATTPITPPPLSPGLLLAPKGNPEVQINILLYILLSRDFPVPRSRKKKKAVDSCTEG